MKKVLTSFLALSIAFTQTLFFLPEVNAASLPLIGAATAEAATAYAETASAESTDNNTIKDIYDLVALVVDTQLMDDGKSYLGLVPQYPDKLADTDDMPGRIKRFAKDLQKNSPKTIVKVLVYDSKKETLLDVISALENLYKNGDENINSRLRGAILIGNVPLPVVSKNGNRFISMLPLTDFDEKSYIYNPTTQSFDLNTKVAMQKPEIWHGVLRAPEGNVNKLAGFFDKNHLYHEGVAEFAVFNQKLFYGDFVSEEKDLNEDEYKLYQNFIENMDDIVYMRFNKRWANRVVDAVMGTMEEMGANTAGMDEANLDAMPDIYTREQIMNFHKDYAQLVTGYLGEANDLTVGTARYNPQEDGVDYVPALVSMKDRFAMQYLRQANDAIENKVNEIVGEMAQKLPIVDEAKVNGTVGDRDFAIDTVLHTPAGMQNVDVTLSNDSYSFGSLPIFKNLLMKDDGTYKFYINGMSSDFLDSPKKCLPYLGSEVTTRALSSDNMILAMNTSTLGVNVFGLSKTEALELTKDNKPEPLGYGLLIEDYPDYGIPAFYSDSKLLSDYKLEKGDIILKVRPFYRLNFDVVGKMWSTKPANKCEDVNCPAPGQKAYKKGDHIYTLPDGYDKPIDDELTLVKSPKELQDKINDFTRTVGNPKNAGDDEDQLYVDAESKLQIYYYDASAKTVKSDADITYDNLSPLANLSGDKTAYGQGVIDGGRNDLSGCFFTSTVMHDDRCLPMFAKYPVLDPAASVEPFLSDNTGLLVKDGEEKYTYFQGGIPQPEQYAGKTEVYRYQFPIGKQVIAQNDDGVVTKDSYKDHAEVFQLPAGVDSPDALKDKIDDMYMDACFNMLPSVSTSLPDSYLEAGFYERFMNTAKSFVSGEGKKNQNIPYGGNGDNIKLYNTTREMTLDINSGLSLADFAIRYGLFDGIDNDGNGKKDFGDWGEADEKYGLDPDNIPAVSRALLGVRFNWENPSLDPAQFGTPEAGEYWYPMPRYFNQPFSKDNSVILKVKPTVLKEIPSLIFHNEPSNYTIAKQLESAITPTLPIDDPRYVAFMDTKGQTQKINYPNLIKSQNSEAAPNVAQFQIDIDQLADELLKIPGSENLNKEYIKQEIFKVTIDSPELIYDTKNHSDYMVSAEAGALRDSLLWNSYAIDDKHEYILNYYLNDSKKFFPYIADNNKGYEAAYLLFNGGSDDASDYIDFAFNKGTTNDGDPDFDIFASGDYTEYAGSDTDDYGYPKDDGDGDDSGDQFVTLKQFFKELMSFFTDIGKLVKGFDPKVGLEYSCSNGEEVCVDNEQGSCEEEITETISKITLTPSKNIIYADGEDYADIEITAYNQDNLPLKSLSPALNLSLSQDSLHPAFIINENFSSKALKQGKGVVRILSTSIAGDATLSVQAVVSEEETFDGDNLSLKSAAKKIELTADIDGAQIGTEDVITLYASLLANGQLEGSATNQVTFTIIDGKDSAVFDGTNVVKAENGVARVVIKPLTKNGIVKIEARVSDGPAYATGVKEVIIGSGEPAKIEVMADTNVLLANGKSRANFAVKVLDKYGNVTADQFNKVSIFTFGDVTPDMTGDQNRIVPGLQVDATNGIANATILSGNKIGEASIYAVLMTSDVEYKLLASATDGEDIDFKGGIGASRSVSILGDGSLKMVPKYTEKINADGVATSAITVELLQTNGTKVSGYNGEIIWKLNDPTYGGFTSATDKAMKAGTSSATFKSTTVSGKPGITVTAPGFAEVTFNIETLPGPAKSISVVADKDTILTGGFDSAQITAKLLDQYGNLAYTSPAGVNFAPSTTSQTLMTFEGSPNATALNGFANARIKSTANSGKAALIVTDTGNNGAVPLEKGKLEIDFKKRISNANGNNFEDMSPRALYINLLGGAFYDMGKNDLGNKLLFSGQSQAILTTTAVPNDKKRVVSVDGFGQIETLDQNVKETFVPASESFKFNKVKFKDDTFGVDVGEVFFVPKDGLEFGLIDDEFKNHKEGIFVKELTAADKKEFAPKLVTDITSNTIVLKKGVTDYAKIDKYGRVTVLSNDVTLRIPAKIDAGVDKSYFSVLVEWKNFTVAQIQFRQNVLINNIAATNTSTSFVPGIYIKLANDNSNYALKESFSRYSTEFGRGKYIVDTTQDIDRKMAPGSGFDSSEGAVNNPGVGFSKDNKNMLLFAAGNSVGESNLPYASESGVVLGDPTVKIDNVNGFVGKSNYTHDIGQMVDSESESFQNIEPFDYNGDGYDDMLMTFSDGRIKLLENENSNQRFVDRGVILYLPNKIFSLSRIDIDNDGFDDLIIGTEESCIQGEKCLYLYKNNNGALERQKLELNTADKIYDIKTADLNDNGTEDLVISDSSGNVYVFWVDNGKISPNGDKLGNFGVDINSSDMIGDVLVYYGAMKTMPDIRSQSLDDQNELLKFVPIKVNPDVTESNNVQEVEQMLGTASYDPNPDNATEPKVKPLNFLLPYYTNDLATSTKQIVDVNGAPMALGDIVNYTITLRNTSSFAINDLIVSDITPSAQEIDMESLGCEPGCPYNLRWAGTDAVLRDYAIRGVTVPANGTRIISYQAKITKTPEVKITVGNFTGLVEYANSDDKYPDILVQPELSDKRELTYFFSKSLDELKHVVYEKHVEGVESSVKEMETNEPQLSAEDEQRLADSMNTVNAPSGDEDASESEDVEAISIPLPDGTPESMKTIVAELNKDSDNDGLPDRWDDTPGVDMSDSTAPQVTENAESSDGGTDVIGGAKDVIVGAGKAVSAMIDMAGNVSGKVSDAIDAMRCSNAGCLPIPYNQAFLVPGKENPAGTAILAVGTESFPFFSFLYPSMAVSNFRLYLSPTLTLGLGMAVCAGPATPDGAKGMCFIGALPAQKIPAICDAVEAVVSEARKLVNQAVGAVNDAVSKVTAVISNGESDASDYDQAGPDDIQHNGAYGSSNSKLTFKDSVNIKIPGFPGFFTNWLDAQIDEIFTKLLDLPDFYLILPDFGQLFSKQNNQGQALSNSFNNIENVDDFFTAMQQIPLIQLQPEEVQIKIPMISQEQIEKYKKQSEQFKKHLDEQIKMIKEFWGCDENTEKRTICDSALVKMTGLLSDVQKVMDTLEYYKNLPKTLAKMRFALSKYALQIVCYLDAVMDLTGGYIKRQGKIIQSWIRAIREIIEQFKGWKAVLDLAVDYENSCDECKNEKYGEIGFIFQIFGSAFPDLPIIQIPKWPDFVFDFSKIEMGMKITWPDFVFDPLPLNLPDLPTVNLPMIQPSVEIDLDGLIPSFDIARYIPPKIDFELPDLPPLPMPKFPNIPRPPKIPKLPKPIFDLAVGLKPIFKILCLIKKGLLIFPENTVKGQVEGLTQPGVKPVLPITLNFNIKPPSFSYDAPVEFDVNLKMKAGVNTGIIYGYVKEAADKMNSSLSKWVSEFNGYMQAATKGLNVDVDRVLRENMGVSPNWEIDLGKVKEELKGSYNFDLDDPNNLYYYLAAAQDYVAGNDPILNKKASELNFIAMEDVGENADVVNLRNSLLAYAQNFESQGEIFDKADNLEEFNTLIASLPKADAHIDDKFVAKDLGTESLSSKSSNIVIKKALIADIDLNNVELNEGKARLDAATQDGNLPSVPQPSPKGIFVFVGGTLENENVVSYVNELNDESKIIFNDVDKDGDTDIVYTMGNDVYLKKNYSVNKPAPTAPDIFTVSNVSSYSTLVKTSVQGLESTGNKNNGSTLSFLPQKYSDVIGYEVSVSPSLTDIDNNLYRGTYRYLLVKNPENVYGKTDQILGVGNVINSVEKTIHEAPSEFSVSGGDLIYAIADSGLIVNGKEVGLNAGKFYTIPKDNESPTLGLALGTVEHIKVNAEKFDKLFMKTSFIYGDRLRTLNNGGATLSFENGATVNVQENETFEMLPLTNENNPIVSLNIPNGNYFAVVYSIHSDGSRSLASTPASISPQICGITTPPLPALSNTSLEVAVTKTLEINASASFDPAGAGIKSYYIDTDPKTDTNSDGDPTNDPDLWSDLNLTVDGPDKDGNVSNDMINPLFKVGPYDEIGKKDIVLNIVNGANITSKQPITINVYVPKIALEPIQMDSSLVSGNTSPSTSDMPFTLMRQRYLPRVEDDKLKLVPTEKKITTPTSNENGQYFTSGDGTYKITDFDLDDIIYIKDASGKVVVEIDLKTGNFTIKEEGYKYSVYDANPPNETGKVVFKDPNGQSVGTLYFVGDPNYEASIEYVDEFTVGNTADLYGVHVTQPISDEFEFRKYPPNDPNYPDGLYLYYLNEKKQMAAVDTAGNILILDNRITIGKKQNNYLTDPFVYILRFNGTQIAEVYVSPKGKFGEVQITGPNEVPKKFPNGVSPAYLFEEQKLTPNVITSENTDNTSGLFTDLSGDLYKFAISLYKQGLLDPNSSFDPNALISRQDFVMLLLNMLCIVPRPEAYIDPQVFSDVKGDPWVKEGALLGLVKGYEDNDNTALNPFMPDKTVDLAEATSVIVNGLKLIGVLDGDKIPSAGNSVWYKPYIDVALNLNKYVGSNVALKNSFIITKDESVNPEMKLTRGQALEIAYRVIDAYNCSLVDKNNNGVSDFCEAKYNFTDPNGDEDNDLLVNKDECKYGTDARNPDTDGGGVNDGDEVRLGTNPLDPIDDQNDRDGDGLTDQEELNIYKTDPDNPDTDGGGINDGIEVKVNKTDPLAGKDDYTVDAGDGAGNDGSKQVYETEAGVYLVPASCDACPCGSSVEYKADLRKGDILYTIIVNKNETKIYSKSNEQKVD